MPEAAPVAQSRGPNRVLPLPTPALIAVGLLALQGLVGFANAIDFAMHRRSFSVSNLVVSIAILTVLYLVTAVLLWRGYRGARIAAILIDGVAVLSFINVLSRAPGLALYQRPLLPLANVLLAVCVVVLLLLPKTTKAFRRPKFLPPSGDVLPFKRPS